jgi:hypothetical protein
MGAGTNSGKGAGYGNRMPGPASIAQKYPQFSNSSGLTAVDTQPANNLASLYAGVTPSASGGNPYQGMNPWGALSYGNQYGQQWLGGSPGGAAIDMGGINQGGGMMPVSKAPYGGGKPSIGYGGGGGKPRIGYGGGINQNPTATLMQK